MRTYEDKTRVLQVKTGFERMGYAFELVQPASDQDYPNEVDHKLSPSHAVVMR